MREFFLKVLLLSLLVFISFAVVLGFINTSDKYRYFAATIDKHALLKNAPSPKIVIVGGSNVALSIDGALIERELGIPIVNMGLHGGLGLRYMLNEVKPYVGKDDVIVIIPEYQQFLGLLEGDDTLIDLLFLYPEGIRYLEFPDQYLALLGKFRSAVAGQIKGYIQNTRNGGTHPIYNRQAFDRNGDMISHLGQTADVNFANVPLLSQNESTFDAGSVRVLNQFDAYAQSVGAQAVLTFATIPDVHFKASEKQLQLVYTNLRGRLTTPILATPAESTLPIEYFYDTAYHLNARGREIRARQLIGDLAILRRDKKLTGN